MDAWDEFKRVFWNAVEPPLIHFAELIARFLNWVQRKGQ